ncbi:hypothetical protein OF83DRAFT_1097049 [Amylostereum chailletii]|nr:hypothetical protein OF83DRAFT_1097049 [Amylostereum chailletii]
MFILAVAVLDVVVTVQAFCTVLCRIYAVSRHPYRSIRELAASYILVAQDVWWDHVRGPLSFSTDRPHPPTPSSPTCTSPSSSAPPTPTISPSDLLSDSAVIVTPCTSEDAAALLHNRKIVVSAKHAPILAPSSKPPPIFVSFPYLVEDPLRRARLQSFACAAAQRAPAPRPHSGLRPLLLSRQHGLPEPELHRWQSILRPLILPRRTGLALQ